MSAPVMVLVEWPNPRPIAEAKPEMGEILAWDGFRWMQCRWEVDRYVDKPKPYWRPIRMTSKTEARKTAAMFTLFILMPPEPKS